MSSVLDSWPSSHLRGTIHDSAESAVINQSSKCDCLIVMQSNVCLTCFLGGSD